MRGFIIPTVSLRSQARCENESCFGKYKYLVTSGLRWAGVSFWVCNLILKIEIGKQI